jgi:hypothetical protein
MNNFEFVMPAQAGIQKLNMLESRIRGNDGGKALS